MHNYAVPGFVVVLGIILTTGVLGGIRNWITEDWSSANRRAMLAKRLLDAVIAAASVPLFLTVVGNEKTKAAFGEPALWSADYHFSLFILVGFCAIAAVFSQRFLDSLSTQVMRLSDKVDVVQQQVDQTNTITEPLIESEAPEPSAPSTRGSGTAPLADKEARVLRALTSGQFLVRSRSGLISTTGLSLKDLEEALMSLGQRGLARKIATTKGERWTPTEEGRALGH